ncbi:hypothetical protein CWO90_30255 [Bradyrhizobium sp. Leo121]|nr:hypothetical protein CWO90_30255 [Bradyrhizobium sp. Leo121]
MPVALYFFVGVFVGVFEGQAGFPTFGGQCPMARFWKLRGLFDCQREVVTVSPKLLRPVVMVYVPCFEVEVVVVYPKLSLRVRVTISVSAWAAPALKTTSASKTIIRI